MVFLSERKLIAGAIGLLTVALVMSRNKFLMSNLIEISHRVKHAVTGDNYDIMAAGIEQSPWFGRNDGVAIVTGSNTGVGFETALGIAKTGCRVILAVRSRERGDEAAAVIRRRTGSGKVDVMQLDMNSVHSVRTFSEEFLKRKLPLHILVHNAGAAGDAVSFNSDGVESTMALNYLNIVLLTSLLLPVLKTTETARVVIVGSSAHFVGVRDVALCLADRKDPPISGWDLYGSSKLNAVAYSKLLARKISVESNVQVYCLDPGFVASQFYKRNVPFPVSLFGLVADFVAKTPAVGSHSSLFAALSPTPPTSGAYITDTVESSASALAEDSSFQMQLLDETVKKLKAVAPFWNGVWY